MGKIEVKFICCDPSATPYNKEVKPSVRIIRKFLELSIGFSADSVYKSPYTLFESSSSIFLKLSSIIWK